VYKPKLDYLNESFPGGRNKTLFLIATLVEQE
jgi:hypothetical protein